MQPQITQYLQILFATMPIGVVYVAALIVAVIFWRRYPRPALFVVLGTLLFLVVTFVSPIVQVWLMNQRSAGAMTIQQVGQRMGIVSIALAFVRAGGYVLLVCAAFVGRGRDEPGRGFPVAAHASSPERASTTVPPPLPR